MITAEANGWPVLHQHVLRRDGGCVAPQLGAQTPCLNRWGRQPTGMDFEADHVKLEPRMSKKAADSEAFLVTMCFHHHDTWATAHRDEERGYLARRYPAVWSDWIERQGIVSAAG